MSKLFSALFAFATFSLFMALITHPHLGKEGVIWMVGPILVFPPYGIHEALTAWKEKKEAKT
jgi:hypothetical protein